MKSHLFIQGLLVGLFAGQSFAIPFFVGPLISGGITYLINALQGDFSGPTLVTLTQEDIERISNIAKKSIADAKLDTYLSDTSALLSDMSYFTPANTTDDPLVCGNPMYEYDLTTLQEMGARANQILNRLMSNADFGFTIATTYQLLMATHIAILKEKISIRLDEVGGNAADTEIQTFQQEVHNRAVEHLANLNMLLPRVRGHTAQLFRSQKQVTGSRCRGSGKRRKYIIQKRSTPNSGDWQLVESVPGQCNDCQSSSCSSLITKTNNAKKRLSEAEADRVIREDLSPEYVSNMEALEDVVNTPVHEIGI